MTLALRLANVAAAIAVLTGTALAESLTPPPQPTEGLVDPALCLWDWKTTEIPGGTLGVWAQSCRLKTGHWAVAPDPSLPGFVLIIDGNNEGAVVQAFAKAKDAEVSAILPELRKRGHIPDDQDCVFAPAADDVLVQLGPRPRTEAIFEIMPTGARKAALDATPADEVPEPPCGDYGWGPEGIRYFVTDTTHPETVLYVNIGQDGLMFDEKTVTIGD